MKKLQKKKKKKDIDIDKESPVDDFVNFIIKGFEKLFSPWLRNRIRIARQKLSRLP